MPDAPPSPRPPSPRSAVWWWLVLGIGCGLLALALRAPLSLHLSAVPLDPNTPLHAIAARQLAGLGSPTVLSMIDPPQGVPVRMVAWPMLLLAAPLVGTLGALAAVNVATTLLLALQGLAVAAAVAAVGGGPRARALGAVAGITAPIVLHAQSMGRPENLALPAFAVVLLAGRRSASWQRVAVAGTGLLVAAFSSPYQAVPAGLLVVAVLGFDGWRPRRTGRAWGEVAAAVGLAAIPTVAYFIGAAAGDAGAAAFTTSPPEASAAAATGFGELTWPRAMAHGQPVAGLDIAARLADLQVGSARFGPQWGVRTASQVSWLGHVLLCAGLLGAWRHRGERWLAPLVLVGLVCVVCALGPDLRMWSERPWGVPLPWSWTAHLPGVDALVATSRFLSGTVFALCVAAAVLADRLSARWWGLLAVGLVVDGAWRTPRVWPVPAATTRFTEVVAQLPPGPVALWPPIDSIPAQNHELAAVLADRHVHMLSLERETAPDWIRRLTAQDTASFVNLASQAGDGLLTREGARVPQEIRDERSQQMLTREETCIDGVCWRAFRRDSQGESLGHRP